MEIGTDQARPCRFLCPLRFVKLLWAAGAFQAKGPLKFGAGFGFARNKKNRGARQRYHHRRLGLIFPSLAIGSRHAHSKPLAESVNVLIL